MTAINWNDAFWVVIEALFLLICFGRSRSPKDRITFGITAIVAGTLELTAINLGQLAVILFLEYPSTNGGRFIPDYYGLRLFLPLYILLAIATIAFGTWALATRKQSVEKLKL